MKKRDKISHLPTTKTKGYKLHSDGFGQQNNGDFAFSDDLEKWKHGKAKPTKKAPNLF